MKKPRKKYVQKRNPYIEMMSRIRYNVTRDDRIKPENKEKVIKEKFKKWKDKKEKKKTVDKIMESLWEEINE